MTAKNPHTGMSVREQWAAQHRQGRSYPPGSIPGFDEVPRRVTSHTAGFASSGDRHGTMKRESAEARALGRFEAATDGRPSRRYQAQGKARAYSRYGTGRYVPGGSAGSSGEYAPAEGRFPFVLYGAVASACAVVWLAWTRLTVDGSVMGSSMHFMVGMVLFGAILVAGAALGIAVSVMSRGRGAMDVSSVVALSFGKTALAMLVGVIAWFVCLLVAAS